jgi:Ni,Fe-hydrogenase III component G
MNLAEVLAALREAFPGQASEPRAVPMDERFVALPAACIHQAAELLVERFAVRHLSTITGEDTGESIVLLYHFWDGQGLTLQTSLLRDEPRIDTLTDIIPGAVFYEREVSEMLGVGFDGHPDPRRLLLPDDWEGEPPLQKAPVVSRSDAASAHKREEAPLTTNRADEGEESAECRV